MGNKYCGRVCHSTRHEVKYQALREVCDGADVLLPCSKLGGVSKRAHSDRLETRLLRQPAFWPELVPD